MSATKRHLEDLTAKHAAYAALDGRTRNEYQRAVILCMKGISEINTDSKPFAEKMALHDAFSAIYDIYCELQGVDTWCPAEGWIVPTAY